MVGSVFPFLSVLADPSNMENLSFVAWLGDVFGLSSTYDHLVALGILSIIIIVSSSILLIIRSYFIARFCNFMVYQLSRKLLGFYLSQPYPYFLDQHSGDLSSSIISEAEELSGGFLRPTAEMFASVLTVAAVVAMLVVLNPVIAGIGLLVITAFYATLLYACRSIAGRLGGQKLVANRARFRTVNEVIGGIKDVKLSGRESTYVARFSGPARVIADANSKIAIVSDAPRYAMQTLSFGGIIILCLVLVDPAALGAQEGLGTIFPALGLLAFAAQRLSPEVHTAYAAITRLYYGAPVLNRISTTLAGFQPPRIENETPPTPVRLRQAVTLDHVTFGYPNAEYAGITDVSCKIQAGERVGIVGSTGAGKTTLADVILGLLPPQSGVIRIDGTVLTQETAPGWQQSISYVPQEIFLADASISSNIALSVDPADIDHARVQRCARNARIHDFIVSELPLGYDTATGERGVRLSGGQRQRIGIARALYRNADLIVFDEATSALDTVTEREVLDAIDGLPGKKTVVMIAHRLSTLRSCTRLIVMEHGRVAAIGPWDVLMSVSPVFRELVRHSETGVTQVAE